MVILLYPYKDSSIILLLINFAKREIKRDIGNRGGRHE